MTQAVVKIPQQKTPGKNIAGRLLFGGGGGMAKSTSTSTT